MLQSNKYKIFYVDLHYFNQVDDLDERTLYIYPTTIYPISKEYMRALMNDIWYINHPFGRNKCTSCLVYDYTINEFSYICIGHSLT